MKQKIKVIIVVIMLGLFSVNTVLAQGLVPESCRRAANNGLDCSVKDLGALAANMINFLLAFAGVAAMVFLFWGGIRMMLSGGNPDAIKAGKVTLYNAIVGLIIVFASFIILNLLISVVTGNGLSLNNVIEFWPR